MFVVLMFTIPLLYPYGSFTGLDGWANSFDSANKVAFADPISRIVYGIGDVMCHQQEARSPIVNGSQMAFCHRDIGIFIGFAIGLILTFDRGFLTYVRKKGLTAHRRSFKSIWDRISYLRIPLIGVMLSTVTVIEWAIEYTTPLDAPLLRVITGILSGFGIAMILQWIVSKWYLDTY